MTKLTDCLLQEANELDMDDKELVSRTNRQLTYSAASIFAAPFLCISLTFTDHVQWATDTHELPFDTLLYIGLGELLKVFCALWLFPTRDLLNPNAESVGTGLSILGSGDTDSKSIFRLPFSRRDAPGSHGKAAGKAGVVTKVFNPLYS